MNKIFQSRALCLRALDANSTWAKMCAEMSGKNAIYLHRTGSVSAAVQLYRMGAGGCLFCSKRKKILQPRIFQPAPLSGIRHNDGYSDPFAAGTGDKMAAAVSDHMDGRVRCGIFFRRDRGKNLEKAFVELRGCDTVWRKEKECAPFPDQGSSCDDGGAAFASSGFYPVFDDPDNCAADCGHSRRWADGCRPGVDPDCSQEKQEPDRAEGNPGQTFAGTKGSQAKAWRQDLSCSLEAVKPCIPGDGSSGGGGSGRTICLCKRRLCG